MELDDGALSALYLDTAAVVADLLGEPAVTVTWNHPSALPRMRVSGLAGHLARSVVLTEAVLDAPLETGTPLSTPEYYFAGGDPTDLDARGNVRVRATGEETAKEGPEALAAAVTEALRRLRVRLPHESLDERNSLFGRVTTRRTFLEARILEMVVHTDDLAVSIGVSTPDLPPEALDLTVCILLEISRRRHPALALVRALARRERDDVNALRVL